MADLVLGIDGGGTGCRAAIAGADGRVLAIGQAGPANILTNPDEAVRHIEEAARAALLKAGREADNLADIPALLGLAGNNEPKAIERVLQILPFRQAEIHSDGLIALEGAFDGKDGAIASLGTGSVFLLRHEGRARQFGGFGFLIGDGGSGARIGQEALRMTLLAHDGIRTETDMTNSLFAEFGKDPGAMLAFARHAVPGDFARFAPAVFAAAETGDGLALEIVRQAAADVDAVLDRMLAMAGPLPLCLTGGLKSLYPRYLAERHRTRLVQPAGDALSGAIRLARRTFCSMETIF